MFSHILKQMLLLDKIFIHLKIDSRWLQIHSLWANLIDSLKFWSGEFDYFLNTGEDYREFPMDLTKPIGFHLVFRRKLLKNCPHWFVRLFSEIKLKLHVTHEWQDFKYLWRNVIIFCEKKKCSAYNIIDKLVDKRNEPLRKR